MESNSHDKQPIKDSKIPPKLSLLKEHFPEMKVLRERNLNNASGFLEDEIEMNPLLTISAKGKWWGYYIFFHAT